MRSMLKQDVRVDQPAEMEAAEALLLEITEDARKIESRYAKDAAVPEGGE